MKKTIVVIAAAALALAGCGSSGGGEIAADQQSLTADVPGLVEVGPDDGVPAAEDGAVSAEDQEVLDTFLNDSAAESFQAELTAIGMTPGEQITLSMWAEAACPIAAQNGMSDQDVATFLVGDVAEQFVVTDEQATQIWAAAKRHVC